ncbi:hypothetical protein JM18_006895 [Phytophthora kernoviae]|uniref:Cullin family profile domain-containing protein n=2 Tax=Phytophthora kernoviae TaxID=325452 RepID=A0A921SEC6_9STRA|nr:hypothetical protein G195_008457 [Phytophthora kernoviae 00238/432]KAG2520881.1 hypothetical protein JM18_006895 [Phytophthora kernoviae]
MYYSAKAKELLSKVTISEYLREAELLCGQEQKRCEERLHRTTVTQVRQTCCRVLVDDHAEQICEDAESFLINNQQEDLHRLFSLFSELSKESALMSFKVNILKRYIERSGLEVVRKFEQEDATKNPEGYIEALMQVRNKYFELIKDAFGFHPLMRTALDQACRVFANSHPRLPELLAKYTHFLMSRDKKGHSSSRGGIGLPRSPTSLPPGLLDDTLEKKIENISIVFCLIDDKDVFKKYYSKFLARRLIKGISASDEMEILLIQKLRDICGYDFVSNLQKMLKDKMLSKFNNAKELTRTVISELTNFPEQDCSHHLANLVKVKVLTSDGDTANPTYGLNFGFTNRKVRISAIPNSPVETPKAIKVPTREVEEDRRMSLQAAIVRVLKTRRDIHQAQLMRDVAGILANQFVPSTTAIKQNIEILIQKEYLRRHEDDQTRFLYVA